MIPKDTPSLNYLDLQRFPGRPIINSSIEKSAKARRLIGAWQRLYKIHTQKAASSWATGR